MVDVKHLRSVPVEQLGYGLYVVEPDRPWTEIPLMFQGFEISTDEGLEALRSYCEQVYVDTDRCSADALEALDRPAAEREPRPSSPRPETDTANSFGNERYPDTARFERLLRRAWESRVQTRRFIEAVLRGLDGGDFPDTHEGRVAVADLLQTVTGNPGAAVWLSNLDERDAPPRSARSTSASLP